MDQVLVETFAEGGRPFVQTHAVIGTGIVHQPMDGAVPVTDRRNRLRAGGIVGQFRLLKIGSRGGQPGLVRSAPGQNDWTRALFGQDFADRGTNAGPTSGHDDGLSLQMQVHALFPVFQLLCVAARLRVQLSRG